MNFQRGNKLLFIISVLTAGLLGGLVMVISGRAYTGSGMRLIGALCAGGAVVVARLCRLR